MKTSLIAGKPLETDRPQRRSETTNVKVRKRLVLGNQQPSCPGNIRAEGSTAIPVWEYAPVSGSGRPPVNGGRYSLNSDESRRSLCDGFYVYIYLNPMKSGRYEYGRFQFDFEPFYVGKGVGDRMFSNLRTDGDGGNRHLKNTVKSISSGTFNKPIVLFQRVGDEKEALSMEMELILTIGRRVNDTGPLVNIAIGGLGVTGYKHSEEARKAISNYLKGRPHSESHNKAIGEANSRRQYNPESARKISEWRKVNGRGVSLKLWSTPAYREKVVAAMKDSYQNGREPIHLVGADNGMYGKTQTLEARQNISRAVALRNKTNNPMKNPESIRKMLESRTRTLEQRKLRQN